MNLSVESTSPNPNPDTETASVTRPGRPCDTCRRRKSKCVFKPATETCVLCEFHKQPCAFEELPAPRTKRKAVADSSRDVKRRSLSERPRQADRPATTAVRDYADLEGASLLKTTLGLQNHRYTTYVGSSAEHDSKILALRPYDQARAENNAHGSSFRRVAPSVYFHQFQDSDSPDHAHDIGALDAIEALVSPHGDSLIKLYFRIVHPAFPILHKKVGPQLQCRPILSLITTLGLSRKICSVTSRVYTTPTRRGIPSCHQLLGILKPR